MSEKPDRSDFLATARERFRLAAEEERLIREQARIDLKFVAGEQWDEQVKANRYMNNRPALVFNRMHTFVQQVSNEARQNKMEVTYAPREDGDKDTAEVYEGMARSIQSEPEASIALETAVEYSAGGSFGFFRLITDYCNEENFDQDLKFSPVYDPFAVYGVLIPYCFGRRPRYAFIVQHYSKEEYKAEFPDSDLAKATSWDDASYKECGDWIGERIRVAEYWYVEDETKTLKGDGPEEGKERTRTIVTPKVKFCRMNGVEVLEGTETEWLGSNISIYAVLGKQVIIDGRPVLQSLVRHQRDPQTLINVQKTRIAETLSVAPISQWKAPVGSIPAEHMKAWETAHLRNHGVLFHNTRVDGVDLPAPVRDVFEPPIASLSASVAQEIDDMKATAGIYDASLGARSNSVSGIAKQRDQQQAGITNMHFMDNLDRACKLCGKDMAELIPKIYDTERMVRILGADETPKIVKINAIWQEENKKPVHYKIGGDGVGTYDVVVNMGRAFSTKRMESFDMYVQLGQNNPEIALVTSDLMLRNSDLAGADQAAERMKRFISAKFPGVVEQDGESMPPEAQQAIMQSKQEAQLLNAHAQQLEQQIQQLQMEKQAKVVDNEYKMQLAQMNLEMKALVASIETKAQNEAQRDALFADMWKELHGSGVQAGAQAADHAHDFAMSQVGARQAQQQQADQQAHEAGMAAQSQEQQAE